MEQLVKYFAVGGTAAVINFASRFAYELVFPFDASIALAYLTGMIFNFSLSKSHVFNKRTSGQGYREATKFFVISLTGLFVTWVATIFTLSLLGESLIINSISNSTLAHTAGIGFAFIWNFLLHKFISFKETGLWHQLKSKRGSHV